MSCRHQTTPASRARRFTVRVLALLLPILLAAPLLSAGAPDGGRGHLDLKKKLPEGWYARIDTTKGLIIARLMPEQAPQAVAFFAGLAEGTLGWTDPFTGETVNEPYYDGVLIHKVVAGQRFEAGDRTSTGRGAVPYYIRPEGFGPVDFSYGWRLGMTRAQGGKISGSQFFVTESSLPWLNGRHPCFGVVWRGKDVVRAINSVKADKRGKPQRDITIKSVRIFKSGDPPPLEEPQYFDPKPGTLDLRPEVKELIKKQGG